MLKDKRGLEMTAASAEAVQAFDHAIDGYLDYRADLPSRVEAMLAADPRMRHGAVLQGLPGAAVVQTGGGAGGAQGLGGDLAADRRRQSA